MRWVAAWLLATALNVGVRVDSEGHTAVLDAVRLKPADPGPSAKAQELAWVDAFEGRLDADDAPPPAPEPSAAANFVAALLEADLAAGGKTPWEDADCEADEEPCKCANDAECQRKFTPKEGCKMVCDSEEKECDEVDDGSVEAESAEVEQEKKKGGGIVGWFKNLFKDKYDKKNVGALASGAKWKKEKPALQGLEKCLTYASKLMPLFQKALKDHYGDSLNEPCGPKYECCATQCYHWDSNLLGRGGESGSKADMLLAEQQRNEDLGYGPFAKLVRPCGEQTEIGAGTRIVGTTCKKTCQTEMHKSSPAEFRLDDEFIRNNLKINILSDVDSDPSESSSYDFHPCAPMGEIGANCGILDCCRYTPTGTSKGKGFYNKCVSKCEGGSGYEAKWVNDQFCYADSATKSKNDYGICGRRKKCCISRFGNAEKYSGGTCEQSCGGLFKKEGPMTACTYRTEQVKMQSSSYKQTLKDIKSLWEKAKKQTMYVKGKERKGCCFTDPKIQKITDEGFDTWKDSAGSGGAASEGWNGVADLNCAEQMTDKNNWPFWDPAKQAGGYETLVTDKDLARKNVVESISGELDMHAWPGQADYWIKRLDSKGRAVDACQKEIDQFMWLQRYIKGSRKYAGKVKVYGNALVDKIIVALRRIRPGVAGAGQDETTTWVPVHMCKGMLDKDKKGLPSAMKNIYEVFTENVKLGQVGVLGNSGMFECGAGSAAYLNLDDCDVKELKKGHTAAGCKVWKKPYCVDQPKKLITAVQKTLDQYQWWYSNVYRPSQKRHSVKKAAAKEAHASAKKKAKSGAQELAALRARLAKRKKEKGLLEIALRRAKFGLAFA